MSAFADLLEVKRSSVQELGSGESRLALCPDLGGRVYAEVCGELMHRLDLENVADPTRPFNNFGGGNFWPAPEGGKFGFNYRGDEWYVQESINNQPFRTMDAGRSSAVIQKIVPLQNRAGTVIEAVMTRELRLSQLPASLAEYALRGWLAYESVDSFGVLNEVSLEEGLIAAWALEQFDASDETIAFCAVQRPREAINFDFYEHPGDRIAYFNSGFTYKVDGLCRGQIGVRKASQGSFIGFYDLSRNLVCIRENKSADDGLYFNIADNEQPDGPYSAADTYSIFNSDPDMRAFELETAGAARVDGRLLKGSELISATAFAVFEDAADVRRFLKQYIQS